MPIINCRIVHAHSAEELERQVNLLLALGGWSLQGGVSVAVSAETNFQFGAVWWAQTLIRVMPDVGAE